MPKDEKKERSPYKVRCAVTFACYAFVEAKSPAEAERLARKWFRKQDAEAEASHIHDTYEVEEGW